MRIITKHIIHCSDTETGTVKEFRKYHVEVNGWSDVGYHFIIRRDGEIECGRMLDISGAHCRGENAYSVGTCLVGKKDFTEEQFVSLRRLCNMLEKVFPSIEHFPHNAFDKNKTCPNFDVKQKLEEKL